MYFRIEFQGFKTHAEPCLISTDEDRWQAIPYDVYFIGDDKCQLIAKSHKEKLYLNVRVQLYRWHKV